jgi:poly-gamma-glutamate synthesis protein (capsule biosynthesis protein)
MILYGDWAPHVLCCETALPGRCALLNLEGPVLPAEHELAPAPKAGPHLYSTSLPRTDGRLVATLANNHVMDYGESGLALTLEALHACGGIAVGAGATRAAAEQPVVVSDQGVRVAIVACCEAQFGTAQPSRPGVAVLGPWVYDAIRACRSQADAVIVSVHAGVELSPWPAPAIRDLYRSWINAGADVVHGHHPHLPQGFEQYRSGLIVYGLGNLAVIPRDWKDYPDALWSLVVEVDFAARPFRWRAQSWAIAGDERHIELQPDERPNRPAYLYDCNRALAERGLLEALHQEVAVRTYDQYYHAWLRFPARKGQDVGRRRFVTPSQAAQASRQDLRLWYHLFACLTHHDLIATALGVLGGELPDLRTAESRALADRRLPWTLPDRAAADVRP